MIDLVCIGTAIKIEYLQLMAYLELDLEYDDLDYSHEVEYMGMKLYIVKKAHTSESTKVYFGYFIFLETDGAQIITENLNDLYTHPFNTCTEFDEMPRITSLVIGCHCCS